MEFKQCKTMNDAIDLYFKAMKPEQVVLNYNGQDITVKQLGNKIEDFCKHLVQCGVRKGSVVGYSLPNCPEALVLFMALSRLGACAVPLYAMIPDMGRVTILKNSRAQLAIIPSAQLETFSAAAKQVQAEFKIVTIDPNTTGLYSLSDNSSIKDVSLEGLLLKETDERLPLMITSSSGTTGIPKPVLITQANAGSVAAASSEMPLPVDKQKPYAMVIAFPLSTSGIIVVSGTLFAGIKLVFSHDMSPMTFLKMVTDSGAETLAAPPAYYEAILQIPALPQFKFDSVRRAMSGMDFFSPSLFERLRGRFPNLTMVSNGYGLIETSTVVMIGKFEGTDPYNSSFSRLELVKDNGNEIDVRDENGKSLQDGAEGELYIKGRSVINGYLASAEFNAAAFIDGWFKTGDIVRKENASSITLLGRKKYVIKRGGRSISPFVVQNQINAVDGVQESAVVGIPHAMYGEMIWAFLVKKPGKDIGVGDVMKQCRKELANFMVPDQVIFMDAIPKKPGVGKVDFDAMKELAKKELEKIEGVQNA